MSGIIPINKFISLMKNVREKNIIEVDSMVNNIFLEGYSMVNQIILFHDYIVNMDIPSVNKSNILCKLGDIDQNLIKGCDEYIQFMRLVYYIMVTI